MSKRTLDESRETDNTANTEEPTIKKRRLAEESNATTETNDSSKPETAKKSEDEQAEAEAEKDVSKTPQDGVAVDLSGFTFPNNTGDEISGGFGSFVGQGFASYSESKDDTADGENNGFSFTEGSNWSTSDWGSFAALNDGKENNGGNNPDTSTFSWDFGINNSDPAGFAWQGNNDDPPPETINAIAASMMAGEAPEAGDENDIVNWSGAVKVFRLTVTDKKSNKREYRKIGEGELKISTVKDEEGKVTGRLLCRRDKVMTTVFNSPVYADSEYKIAENGMLQFFVQETPTSDDELEEEEEEETTKTGSDDNKEDKKEATPPPKQDVFVAHLVKPKQDGQVPKMLKAIETIQEALKEQTKSSSTQESSVSASTTTSTSK